MNWDQKISETQEYAGSADEMIMVFSAYPGASGEMINRLKNKYPFADEEYLDFLKTSNGIVIETIVLYGLNDNQYNSMHDAEDLWGFVRGVGQDGIPIGHFPSGDCLILCIDGKVRIINYTMTDILEGDIIAESFSTFLNDFLMGSRFLELWLPHIWKEEDETLWTQFLRLKGWL